MNKIIFTLIAIMLGQNIFGQTKMDIQQQLLQQYIGTWYTTDKIQDLSISNFPQIKMSATPKNHGNSLQVEVFRNINGNWKPLLTELIGFDNTTKQIVALGQNSNGDCFIGRGKFIDTQNWKMTDTDFNGDTTMTVLFKFKNNTEVQVKGLHANVKNDWEVKYIKQNPKDKNIGIQLVSVREAMERDAETTLKLLSRMGYSYVETFVYNQGKFYGMSPLEFKQLVEKHDMRFEGSMTFKDLSKPENWKESINWWKKCIDDHANAGVKYLTTSNNQLKSVKTMNELQHFCNYYNAIGKMCQLKGIQFGIHNHTDEFLKVEGKTIYDYLLENTNPKLVSFQADLYWMKEAQVNPIDYFNKYPKRFFSWHAKDDEEIGASGEINFKSIYNHASIAGLNYNLVEVEKYNFDPFVSVDLSFQYMYYEICNEK